MDRRRLLVVAGILACVVAAAQEPVPLDQEPAHRLKFENDDVRVFDVSLQAGARSLVHSHGREGMSVRLGDARIRDSVDGRAPRDLVVKTGEVAFLALPPAFTHSILNTGDTPFRNLFIEFKGSVGAPDAGSSLTSTSGRTLVLDNDRVQVYRQVLPPGATTGMHTHPLKGLGVVVRGGTIAIDLPGKASRTVEFQPGQFQWRDSGLQHELRNVGATVFEAIDVELKEPGR